MGVMVHDILHHVDHTNWSSPGDFLLAAGQPASPDLLIDQPNWSLYTLDRPTASALFVELPPELDLAHSAFVYNDQHRLARRVMVVPFDQLASLAARVTPPEKVIFLFSIGRCGSTLASNVLNEVPGVWGLSEPDAYSRLIMANYSDDQRLGYPRDQVVELIRACTTLLFRPPAARKATVLAVKFRSQALFQADLYHQALPEAACVFLYRDALGWANSFYRMARQYGFPPVLTGDRRRAMWNAVTAAEDLALLRPYVDIDSAEVAMEDAFAPGWACNMAEYSSHLRAGVPFLALRYNEMNRDRVASLSHLFRHCGLPPEQATRATAAFDHDSQAGTLVSRDNGVDGLAPAQLARLRQILARHPRFGDPDKLLPDIYTAQPE